MESHSDAADADSRSGGAAASPHTSPAHARAARDRLDADGARLAERVVTPWWYHLGLGIIVAMLVFSQVLPLPSAMSVLILGIVALPLLTLVYRRRYGESTEEPRGRRSRRLLALTLAVLAAGMAGALVIRALELSAWWGLIPAALVFVATVVLGRRYDGALRSEIAAALGMA